MVGVETLRVQKGLWDACNLGVAGGDSSGPNLLGSSKPPNFQTSKRPTLQAVFFAEGAEFVAEEGFSDEGGGGGLFGRSVTALAATGLAGRGRGGAAGGVLGGEVLVDGAANGVRDDAVGGVVGLLFGAVLAGDIKDGLDGGGLDVGIEDDLAIDVAGATAGGLDERGLGGRRGWQRG